jgi:type III restriction enzyme
MARKLAREVDSPDCPINAIVSVLRLREGWDVQNVTVVAGLRPYTAKANILPEQAIGRGLRLMFRGEGNGYQERVDIIGNKKFIEYVDRLEQLEDLQLETADVKDKLRIDTIQPVIPVKIAYDLALPKLSPILVRKKSLAEEIESLDVARFRFSPDPLPKKPSAEDIKTFKYTAFDAVTMEELFEREYQIQQAQTPQEIVAYYARLIASVVKLPSQFIHLGPKVWEFFETRAFGTKVHMYDPVIMQAMNHKIAAYVVTSVFANMLREKIVEQREPELEGEPRKLSQLEPYPYSRPVHLARKCGLNMVPCNNEFEKEFSIFLDGAFDVAAFSSLPQQFGFSIAYTDNRANLRYYYPDFVLQTTAGEMWLIETKGQENIDVQHKDRAAELWCENATRLTGQTWRYVKVPQKEYQRLQPTEFSELQVSCSQLV